MTKFLIDVLTTSIARVGLLSLLLATGTVAVCAALFSASYEAGVVTVSDEALPRYVLTAIFITSFVVIWYILHMQQDQARRDVYSEIRELLRGDWLVRYDANRGPLSEEVLVAERLVGCNISISPHDYKLELRFDLFRNPLFKAGPGDVIHDVAVRYGTNGEYVVLYYLAARRTLQDEVAALIEPENASASAAELDVEIFGRVTFKKPEKRTVVTAMDGHWYDLNGNISRLLAVLDQRAKTIALDAPWEPTRLSEVHFHPRYFDSDMGAVEFRRNGS